MKTSMALALLASAAARGALYPTKPAATTWYTLSAKERSLDLKWRDTPEEPRAAALGSVRVQLLSGDNVVAYLWPEVDAAAGHANVKVPRDVALASGSEYYIRFVPSSHRSAAVYTADFTIVNATLPPVAPSALAAARQAFSGPANVAASAASTSNVSLAAATGTTMTVTLATSSKTAPSSTPDALGTAVNAARAARLGWTGGAASFKSKALFVIWPVLIGVALAV